MLQESLLHLPNKVFEEIVSHFNLDPAWEACRTWGGDVYFNRKPEPENMPNHPEFTIFDSFVPAPNHVFARKLVYFRKSLPRKPILEEVEFRIPNRQVELYDAFTSWIKDTDAQKLAYSAVSLYYSTGSKKLEDVRMRLVLGLHSVIARLRYR